MGITYDQVSEFISHESRKPLIKEEYRMTAKPSSLENPTSNAILEKIHQVLGNLVHIYNIETTYVEIDDSWLVNLAA